jgi:hypothetical protein
MQEPYDKCSRHDNGDANQPSQQRSTEQERVGVHKREAYTLNGPQEKRDNHGADNPSRAVSKQAVASNDGR